MSGREVEERVGCGELVQRSLIRQKPGDVGVEAGRSFVRFDECQIPIM